MTLRMLIDANHPEETRVVVMNGHRLEEFDNESATKKQLKGNIYLAKVTRVEPSLQAAFIEYGGNRHGFLAFAEIHPDYYQIPVADREALLREEAQQARTDAQLEDEAGARAAQRDSEEAAEGRAEGEDNGVEDNGGAETIEQVGRPDALDEVPRARPRARRSYKIQEVIKKRQIMLVQVVKEERGNKGAALTTYLSLAGRYCVVMPNTARGGGISRKITNLGARRKLKDVVADLDVPEGMGVIVRTAGMNRTKAEIKRDFESLLRQWDQVRETTLQSTAPTLVYEEASLIKRAIRDLYTKEIEEIHVEGEEGYRAAKEVMRYLLPSHAKKVQPYRDRIPLFHRYQAEQQLDGMHSSIVQLRSGGYVVISPTEALVAIDVNSGKSTREHHIEETALKTNLEAAEEVARQLRLRDLAGLIVIDFIDMEDARNNRAVERQLKESLKTDRARVQIGRISSFGLLELSRQRLRPSLHETSSVQCLHCAGSGFVRSTESAALYVLRAIEEEAVRDRAAQVTVHVPTAIALYLLNQKREHVNLIQERYGLRAFIYGADDLIPPNFRLEVDVLKSADAAPPVAEIRPVEAIAAAPIEAIEEPEELAAEEAEEEASESGRPEEAGRDAAERDDGRRRRRRRRRRRPGDAPGPAEHADPQQAGEAPAAASEGEEAGAADSVSQPAAGPGEGEAGEVRRRRRGRRGGRRRPEFAGDGLVQPGAEQLVVEPPPPEQPALAYEPPAMTHEQPAFTPAPWRSEPPPAPSDTVPVGGDAAWRAEPAVFEQPRWQGRELPHPEVPPTEQSSEPGPFEHLRTDVPPPAPEVPAAEPEPELPAGERRRGWWQRRFSLR